MNGFERIKSPGRVMRGRLGQSFVEYVVITGVLLLALNSGDPSPMSKLYNALRNNYRGFSFAVTRPVIVPSDPVGDIMAKANDMANKAKSCTGSPVDCVKDLARWSQDAGVIPTKEDIKNELVNALLNSIDVGPFQPIIDWMGGK